ncbi:MAG TPA: hypothetical protein HPP97_12380 [Desulfuromonadales bacterium]|nr:hypothetical protein [Desulfuromonadales bacterium]
MAVESLGSFSSANQVNFQVKTETVPQVAQDAKKSVKSAQADTVSISAQALKLADDKNAAAKEEAKKADEQRILQLANDKSDAAKNTYQSTQNSAVRAYASVSANQ